MVSHSSKGQTKTSSTNFNPTYQHHPKEYPHDQKLFQRHFSSKFEKALDKNKVHDKNWEPYLNRRI